MTRQRIIVLLGIFFIIFLWLIFSAPNHFPTYKIFTVDEGKTASEIAEELKNFSTIRSSLLFKLSLRFFSPSGMIRAGDYYFTKSESVLTVAYRLARGRFGVPVKKITLPEGVTNAEIAKIIKKQIPDFDMEGFLAEAESFEGRLFPDTYFFHVTVRPSQVVTSMNANFERRVAPLQTEIANSERSFEDIITMASLIEEEAKVDEVRQMISGILWKRVDSGMLLQVDAVFPYIIGKNTFELSLEDLKNDSPYNTYKHQGLPPGAITNPGLSAIEAALRPIKSDYWYYLADRQNMTHYAVDFEEHKANKARYLP